MGVAHRIILFSVRSRDIVVDVVCEAALAAYAVRVFPGDGAA